MKHQSLLLAVILIFLFPINPMAEPIKVTEREPHKLVHNGVSYQFKFIPILNKQGELMWYEGEMSGTRSDGSLVFTEKTDLRPSCDMDFPSISLIDIPLADGSNPQTYILFCEATDGTSNLHRLRFYREGKGFMGTFEVNAAPQIEPSKKIPEFTIYKIFHRKKGGKLSWPVFYRIIHDKSGKITLIEKDIKSAKAQYQRILQAFYQNLTPQEDGINEHLIANKLIILAITEDIQTYCRTAKDIKNHDLLVEIRSILTSIHLPPIQCKDI